MKRRAKALERILSGITPGAGYVITLELAPDRVRVLGTFNPEGRIRVLAAAIPHDRELELRAYRTDHYQAIAGALEGRFPHADQDALGLVLFASPREVYCALAEIDLSTGGPAPLLGAA